MATKDIGHVAMGNSSSSSTDAQFLSVIAEGQRREAEERAERALHTAALARAHEATRSAQAAQWAQRETVLVERMAALAHELDLARGAVRARSLLETCLKSIGGARQRLSAASVPPTSPSGAATALLDGSAYPALVVYLRASAVENGADPVVVLARARKLYGALSGPMHESQQAARPQSSLPRPRGTGRP
jgi:hypothetical protein